MKAKTIVCFIVVAAIMCFRINVINAQFHGDQSVRLNIKNNEKRSGIVIIKATSNNQSEKLKLKIDGEEQTDLYKALEKNAKFVFDVKGTNVFFKNGVTMGNRVLKIFDDTMKSYQTIAVSIPADKLKIGQDNKISIRSGTKVSPFDHHSEENRDDFIIKNVRLILSDGTVIRDLNGKSVDKELTVGDRKRALSSYDFQFDLSANQFQSMTKEWDTTKVADGSYEIKAIGIDGQKKKVKMIVDNTAPKIIPTIVEGKEYKGKINIHATVKDRFSDVKKITAKIDRTHISLPYITSSAHLAPGKHVLKITATDSVGNKKTVKRTFFVTEENPLLPKSTTEKSSINHAKLSVKVKDPTNDNLDVSFYQAYKYTGEDRQNVKISMNKYKTEPPKQFRPEGEKSFNQLQYEKVQTLNNKFVQTNSTTKFPYHRFDVRVDGKVDDDDTIEFIWKGYSLPNRKVTMYVWNYKKGTWVVADSKIAQKKPFTLKGNIEAKEYVNDQKISVIVQDQIGMQQKKYDYSFVWLSDTQYYSANYPHVLKSITDWIVKNKKTFNIQYMFHTGDLVDYSESKRQWENISRYMKTIEKANIPYGVLAGNHDVQHKYNDYKNYHKYFGTAKFKNKSFYGDSYENNKGHYDLISVKGNDYLMLYMGWGITDKEIKWMNEVLKKYPERIAILSVHEYLLVSGNRSPIGDKLFEEVVVPNKNVALVLCGHYHDSETLIDEIDDNGDGKVDRKVYQMLADYQGAPKGGQGFIRLLQVDTSTNTIDVKTYSPYLNQYNYYDFSLFPSKDEFPIPLNLEKKEKMVATNYFEMNVYTNQLIGKVNDVESGNIASTIWSYLAPAKTYYWYTVVEDQFNGKKRSNIWGFTIIDGQMKIIDNREEEMRKRAAVIYPLPKKDKRIFDIMTYSVLFFVGVLLINFMRLKLKMSYKIKG